MTQQPRIAILGAGPVGLEAALAAARAGVSFTVFEAAPEVAANVRDWSHVRLFSPWSMNVSPRMRRALGAGGAEPPDGDACPTGGELVDRVLDPVAALPEVAPHVRTGVTVVAVSREGLLKSDAIGAPERSDPPFRLLLRSADGREWTEQARVVLDCTGSWGNPNSLGDGGIPAPGEEALDDAIVRRIPDFEAEAGEWAGRTILLVGAGHSGQTAARGLAELAEDHPGTRVLWALRSPEPRFDVADDDPLPERARLGRAAEALVRGESGAVEAVTGVVVDALALTDPDGSLDGTTDAGGSAVEAGAAPSAEPRIAVTLRSSDGSRREVIVDRIVSLTGGVGDHRIYRQLQVHECWATQGPMKLAAALLGASSGADCLDQESHGADTLVNPEPGFFILGDKSYGRNNTFLMRVGWQQVDEVFALLGLGPDDESSQPSGEPSDESSNEPSSEAADEAPDSSKTAASAPAGRSGDGAA